MLMAYVGETYLANYTALEDVFEMLTVLYRCRAFGESQTSKCSCSSVNFFIFCTMNSRFRKAAVAMIWELLPRYANHCELSNKRFAGNVDRVVSTVL